MPNPTYRQFSSDMRAAGWTNKRQGWWTHPETNTSFYAFNGVPHENGGFCEAWEPYAERGELPSVRREDAGRRAVGDPEGRLVEEWQAEGS